MGDRFQIIVDREVSQEDAPHLAKKIREWLVARRVIEPELGLPHLRGLDAHA